MMWEPGQLTSIGPAMPPRLNWNPFGAWTMSFQQMAAQLDVTIGLLDHVFSRRGPTTTERPQRLIGRVRLPGGVDPFAPTQPGPQKWTDEQTDEHPDPGPGGELDEVGTSRGCEHVSRLPEGALRHHQEWLHAVRIV